MTSHADSIALAAGGFVADTEIMTTTGPVRIDQLSAGDEVYALDLSTRVLKPKPVTEIVLITAEDGLVEIKSKRADFRVAPGQRVPYQTKAVSRPRIQAAGDLEQQSYYKFINEWQSVPGNQLETVDITDHLENYEACAETRVHGHTFRAALPERCTPCRNNSHTGYFFDALTFKRFQDELEDIADEVTVTAGPNHHRRPYQFDGDDFIEFLGWYVTEGSLYEGSKRDTIGVQIAQQDTEHRKSIETLLERMGLNVRCNDRSFRFGSKLFGTLLKTLCGSGSYEKHLPDFVWDLPVTQQKLLMDVLVAGDGNDFRTYYTASVQLAHDVLQLALRLGMKPRYTRREQMWQIYLSKQNDGLQSAKHVSRVRSNEELYRLTVEDFPVVMAGRNGKFQWIGTSSVS